MGKLWSHTEETKRLMSEKKKKWCLDNPDKLLWKKNDKFRSIPCETFKAMLKKNCITFVEEFKPLAERLFLIDIAFPDKKIGIEINGNQHYEKDGNLKPYYQERHDLIEAEGWKVIELHFSVVYNNILTNKLIDELKKAGAGEISYDFYINEQKKIRTQKLIDRENQKQDRIRLLKIRKLSILERKKLPRIRDWKSNSNCFCSNCGIPIVKQAKTGMCVKCYSLKKRVVVRPTKEELEKLIKEFPMTKIGKYFGVSDNAIRKWCKTYGIVLKG